MQRCFLCKEQIRSVQRQISVNFVGRYLVISLYAVLSACVHKHSGALYICFEEYARVFYGAVNMAFRRKVYYYIRFFFFKKIINKFSVADIALYKAEVFIVHNRGKRRKIARICQLVQAHYSVIRIFSKHVKYKIRAYKPGAAGYYNRHRFFLIYQYLILSSATFFKCTP